MITEHHANVPPAVRAWLAAHGLHDADAEVAQMTDNVVVVDNGIEYSGRAAARAWTTSVNERFEYSATVLTADVHGDAVVATTHVEGDFPGSPINLRYQFLLSDGLISALTVSA